MQKLNKDRDASRYLLLFFDVSSLTNIALSSQLWFANVKSDVVWSQRPIISIRYQPQICDLNLLCGTKAPIHFIHSSNYDLIEPTIPLASISHLLIVKISCISEVSLEWALTF